MMNPTHRSLPPLAAYPGWPTGMRHRHAVACLAGKKTLLALAAMTALLPGAGWALDFANAPPGNAIPYVAPNVIITFDDSGSMGGTMSGMSIIKPDGSTKTNPTRMEVLQWTTERVFRDESIIPEGSIRLGWQSMHNNVKSGKSWNTIRGGDFKDADDINKNGGHQIKIFDNDRRAAFIEYVQNTRANSGTPTHKMMRQADEYMRGTMNASSPWASVSPITGNTQYLACRRNYHILMSDGGWQTRAASDKAGTIDGIGHDLDDDRTYDLQRPYYDNHDSMIADWAFKSWAIPLQDKNDSRFEGEFLPSNSYLDAIADGSGSENFGNDRDGDPAIISDPYWNPRHDPATWPHMVTHSIGITEAATTWDSTIGGTTTPDGPAEREDRVPFSFDKGKNGDLPSLITGVRKWPLLKTSTEKSNGLDLWHASLNGRGRFYAVEEAEDLEKAFKDIIKAIRGDTEAGGVSAATSGSNTGIGSVGLFATNYYPALQWKGEVSATSLDVQEGELVGGNSWGETSSADKLDALGSHDQRVIISWSDEATGNGEKGGVAFRWDESPSHTYLSEAQNASLGENSSASPQPAASQQGANILNYIRGERALEGSEPSAYPTDKPFRERKSRQGDIIHSNIWFTPPPSSNYAIGGYAKFASKDDGLGDRTPMIYVGGNDGMLHGFSAEDGTEKIAYVPKGVIPALPDLTSPQYTHRYYVDGSPMVGDVAINSAPDSADDWRSLLVGTLGAGGKGYFVLDVTQPEVFAEANASALALLDRTLPANKPTLDSCPEDAVGAQCDLGHIFSIPSRDAINTMRANQITRLNNNRWAAIMGNGYNSRNQRPVLLIQYLDGDMELLTLPVTEETAGSGLAADNGLSTPRVVDIDGDDRADVVYAGDLLGNVWKFDLTGTNTQDWKVAFEDAPLYTALGPDANGARSVPQPITAPPTVRANNRGAGGLMVAFGTGRNVTLSDPDDAAVQSIYGVLDSTHYERTANSGLRVADGSCTPSCPPPSPVGSGTDLLVQQTVGEQHSGSGASSGYTFWAVDDPEDSGSGTVKIDWDTHKGWYMDLPLQGERLLKNMDFYQGTNILSIYSQIPATGTPAGMGSSLPESCEAIEPNEERQFLTLLNVMDGRRPAMPIMDLNGDGFYNGDDHFVARVEVGAGAQTQTIFTNKEGHSLVKVDGDLDLRMPPELGLRPGWRQLR